MTTATSTASTAFVSNFLRFLITFFLLAFTVETNAAQLNDWRSRSVYQILTDRFARTDGSTTAPCILDDKKYCGGTWQGIINKLDYIQGMGFTAVSLLNGPDIFPSSWKLTCCRSGYRRW